MANKTKGRQAAPAAPKVFHICRYEQWFELPASSGYCSAGPLKFFRFFVSGSDPSAKEFHERVERLSRHGGDAHHLVEVVEEDRPLVVGHLHRLVVAAEVCAGSQNHHPPQPSS